jgi:hypothetical protein
MAYRYDVRVKCIVLKHDRQGRQNGDEQARDPRAALIELLTPASGRVYSAENVFSVRVAHRGYGIQELRHSVSDLKSHAQKKLSDDR